MTTYCATGHRPTKVHESEPYSYNNFLKLSNFAYERLIQLPTDKDIVVITGMALGWDISVAWACHMLKIPFIAAIPFEGQEKKWSEQQQATFRNLREMASHVKVVCPGGYDPYKMIVRDHWMVDNSEQIISLYNGDLSGGTYQTVKYANAQSKPITNVWDQWKEYSNVVN